jgi:uncharacterized protein YndB with AHSA1/START domain
LLEFNNKLEIKRPIAEVFQFLSDFENMPKWNYFVVNVKKISDGPVGINTAFRQKRKTDSQEYKIIEYEPNKSVAIEIQPPSEKLTRFNRHTMTMVPWLLMNGNSILQYLLCLQGLVPPT